MEFHTDLDRNNKLIETNVSYSFAHKMTVGSRVAIK